MAKRYQDKYYTPASVVKAVLKVIEKEIMPLDKFNRIIYTVEEEVVTVTIISTKGHYGDK
jgi:hypothetical protein